MVFRPKNMSPYELMVGKIKARKAFYSPWSIPTRLPANVPDAPGLPGDELGHFKGVRVEEKRLASVKNDLYDKPNQSS